MLAAGTYKAHPVKAWLGESTNKGTPFVGVMFTLESGEQIAWQGWLTDGAMKSTMRAVRACGFVGDDLSDLSSIEGAQKTVYLVVEHEEDDKGTLRPRVRWVNETEGGPMMSAALTGSKAKEIAARMKAAIIAERQASGAGTERKRATGSDDDLPY